MFWNELSDSHIKIHTLEEGLYDSVQHEFNESKYRCDDLVYSDVLFLGTCDVLPMIGDINYTWAKMIHNKLYPSIPFIALGSPNSGLPTIIRRLYSYITQFGAPKIVYMTLPSFNGREYVNKSMRCYTSNTKFSYPNVCSKHNVINDEEHFIWHRQVEVNLLSETEENVKYLLEERFAFLETICKAHNIELKWSFNLSSIGVIMLHKYCALFDDISKFMKDTCVGIPILHDHNVDHTIGANTHAEIFSRFMNPESWDYSKFKEIVSKNYDWLIIRHGQKVLLDFLI